MKIAVWFLVVGVVVSVEAYSNHILRDRRGFKNGAADRFSHGFGKRTETVEDSIAPGNRYRYTYSLLWL